MKAKTSHFNYRALLATGKLTLRLTGLVILMLEVSACRTGTSGSVRRGEPERLVMETPYGSVGDFGSETFHKGVSLVSRSDKEFMGEQTDRTIEQVETVGVNALSIVVTWFQKTTDDESIAPGLRAWGSARDEALVHAINEAHRNGLRVMLKPHVDVLDRSHRGLIAPSLSWFKSYEAFIMHYARIAQEYQVALFCVGTELENASFEGWRDQWIALIDQVRSVYKGKLTYAANWTEYKTVCFWDRVDFVGVDAYFPITDKTEPSEEELRAGWRRIAAELAGWKAESRIGQPIIFTEVGYQSTDGSNITPWNAESRKPDENEQAMALDSLMEVMSQQEWFQGMYWWNYLSGNPRRPLDFTISGKKAEQILKKWYRKKT